MLADIFEPYKKYVPLLLRLVLAAVFIAHGWDKITDPSGTAGLFGKVGIPQPTFLAWTVALVEFSGGIFLLLGVLTRLAAALLAIIVIGAILTGLVGGYELGLTLLAAALSVLVLGSGPISVEARLGEPI